VGLRVTLRPILICGIEGELSLHVVDFFPRYLKLSSDGEHTDDFPHFHQATLRDAGDLKTCKPRLIFSLINPPTFSLEAERKYASKVVPVSGIPPSLLFLILGGLSEDLSRQVHN